MKRGAAFALMIAAVLAAAVISVAQTPGSGTVTGGDGTVMNAAPGAGGALALHTAGATSVLGNPTGSTAAPSYTTAPVVASINGVIVLTGAGAPAGSGATACAVANPAIYLRTDGSTSTTFYVCTATNTWTAK